MAVAERPIGHFEYHKSMIAFYSKAYDDACEERDKLILDVAALQDKIKENISVYKTSYKIDLMKYEEFVENTYIDGKLLKVAKGAYLNKTNDYELVSDLWDLLKYAKAQEKIKRLNHDIDLYYKLSHLNARQYTSILKTFYFEVHKKMILEGYGYVFEDNIGWTCINRVKIVNKHRKRKCLDFDATKKREAQLKAEGKKIFNKEEADWCAANGIEYIAEDKRVFKDDEYLYEIPIINCRLPNGSHIKMEVPNYRSVETRSKTYDDFLKEANGDLNKLCSLNIDLRAKLALCTKANNILYTNFIRNDNQKSINAGKINSKD